MTAAEIVESIKKLRAEVRAFMNTGSESGRVEEARVEPKVNYLPQAEAERRAAAIFRENHELFRRLAQ